MVISIEIVDKYARTFFDFWRLRPRRFFLFVTKTPEKYLTAPQFLASSLALLFALHVASISLSRAVLKQSGVQEGMTAEPKALAVQAVVFVILNLFLGSLQFWAISRAWPVKGKAAFSSIFELHCYTVAIFVPFVAFALLVSPFIAHLVSMDILPAWCYFVQPVISLMISLAGLAFWQFPGVAFLNAVSTGRLWFGFCFWHFILGAFLGLVAAIADIIFSPTSTLF